MNTFLGLKLHQPFNSGLGSGYFVLHLHPKLVLTKRRNPIDLPLVLLGLSEWCNPSVLPQGTAHISCLGDCRLPYIWNLFSRCWWRESYCKEPISIYTQKSVAISDEHSKLVEQPRESSPWWTPTRPPCCLVVIERDWATNTTWDSMRNGWATALTEEKQVSWLMFTRLRGFPLDPYSEQICKKTELLVLATRATRPHNFVTSPSLRGTVPQEMANGERENKRFETIAAASLWDPPQQPLYLNVPIAASSTFRVSSVESGARIASGQEVSAWANCTQSPGGTDNITLPRHATKQHKSELCSHLGQLFFPSDMKCSSGGEAVDLR